MPYITGIVSCLHLLSKTLTADYTLRVGEAVAGKTDKIPSFSDSDGAEWGALRAAGTWQGPLLSSGDWGRLPRVRTAKRPEGGLGFHQEEVEEALPALGPCMPESLQVESLVSRPLL